MKKIILLICLGLFFGLGRAQDSIAPTKRIELSGNYSLNSTALNSAFISSIYQGKFIDTDLKNSVKNHLGAYNLFGADISSNAFYFQKISPNFSFYAGVGYNIDLGAQFTGDLYNVIFYGNKDYAGKTADLSGTQVKFMQSQSIHFGLSKTWSDTNKTSKRMDYGISFVKGQNLYDIYVAKGSLFTEQKGEYLDITMEGNMFISDTNNTSIDAFNGLGGGLNFMYVEEQKNDYRLLFEVKNAGFIIWNHNTVSNRMDTTLRFEGIAIDNIFTIQDSTFENITAQSIAGDGLKTQKAAHWMMLPFSVRANYRHFINEKNYLEGDIYYKYWGTYIPKLIVTYGRQFTSCLSAEINAGYGGYATFHLGANFIANCNRFQLKAGASDLLGFIAPKQFANQGLFLMAAYSF